MVVTLHLWWLIPTIVTVVAMGWALTRGSDSGGYLPDMTVLFTLPPAIIVSLVAWLIGVLCK